MPDTHSEIRLSLASSIQNIPYSVEVEEDVHPYLSIVDDPSVIDKIPELLNEPEMKQFILEMNSSGCVFETFRLAHWYSTTNTQVTRCLCLGFHFRDRGLFSSFPACMDVAGHILKTRLKANAPGRPPLLEVQHAFLQLEGIRGMVMDLFLEGIGSDNNEATKSLVKELRLLRPVLCGQAPQ